MSRLQGDGYVVLRTASVRFLLESYLNGESPAPMPEDVARDLEQKVGSVPAPEEFIRVAVPRPIVPIQDHVDVAMKALNLPGSQRQFVETIVSVAYSVLVTEAETAAAANSGE